MATNRSFGNMLNQKTDIKLPKKEKPKISVWDNMLKNSMKGKK